MLVEGWCLRYGGPGRRSRSGWRSRPGREGRYEYLRSRWSAAQRGMGPDRIVMPSPAFDDDLSLPQGVEDLSIQQLVSEPGVERLHIPVLPRRAPLDVRCLGAHGRDPRLHGLGHKLRSIAHQEGGDPLGVAAREAPAERSAPPRAVMASQWVSRVTVFQASFRRQTDHDQAPAYAHTGHSRRHRYRQDPQRGPDPDPRPRAPAAPDRAQHPG